MKKTVAAMAMLWAAAASAAPVEKMTAAEFDRQFRCPETFADEDGQNLALADMLKWYGAHNKKVTIEGFIAFRMRTLKSHRCDVTLRNIASNVEPSRPAPAVEPNQFNGECQVRAMIFQQVALRRNSGWTAQETMGELRSMIEQPLFSGQQIAINRPATILFSALATRMMFARPRQPQETDITGYYTELYAMCMNNVDTFVKDALVDWTQMSPTAPR